MKIMVTGGAGFIGANFLNGLVPVIRRTVQWYLSNQDCVREVLSGEYRKWMDLNYGDRAG